MLVSRCLFVVLCSGVTAFAQCHPPQYRPGATFVDDTSILVRSISIPLHDFAPSKIVCLASSLKARYRDRSNIEVNIFSSHEAAQSSIFGQETTKEDVETLSQMHARYIFNADKQEDYLEILPTGALPGGPDLRAGPFSTRINLPAAATPHCKLEIDSRCLIALERFTYVAQALGGKTSAKVTLTATISRSGKVNHVRVVKTEPVADGQKDPLANAAILNLSSWRLEPWPREEPIQITYSYTIDNALRHVDGTQVQWALPNAISIRVPPE